MKKIGFALMLLFLIIPALALETTLKQEYKLGETLIIEISGNFLTPIKTEEIMFYSSRAFIPMIYDLGKIENKYYVYALLPDKERDYTLIIKNANYYELGKEKKEDLKFNFSVKGNSTLFSVNPGFIITNKDFKIKVEAGKSIALNSEFLNSKEEIKISEGETKTLAYSISKIANYTITNLVLSAEGTKYEIPILILTSKTFLPEEKPLKFSKPKIILTIMKNIPYTFELNLLNTGQEDIENINFNHSLQLKITPEKIEKIQAGRLYSINATITAEKEEEGILKAYSENHSAEIFLLIKPITKLNETADISIGELDETTLWKTCSELEGKKCKENENCTTDEILTTEGFCCKGECQGKSSLGKIIAFAIIILILLIIIFFVYRRLRFRKKTPREFLKEKEKSYEERFKTKEIKGGLER